MRVSYFLRACSTITVAATLAGCNGGGGGGGGGGGNGATDAGSGSGGANGGGAGGSSGANGCTKTSTFQGKPGQLWAPRKSDGQITVFDTQDGKVLKTVPGAGVLNGITGGNGFLLLYNLNGDKDLTPMDTSGQTLAALGLNPGAPAVYGNGKLWAFGVDANGQAFVYSIASPTSVKKIQTPVTVVELTAGSEGAFFMGPTPGPTFAPDVVHMDADGNVLWTIPRGTNPSFDSTVLSGSVPQMTAVTGNVFVKIGSPSGDDVFPFDSTTNALGTPGKIVVKQPEDSRFAMTDGTALYMFDADSSTFYEIDTTTFAVKRTLETGTSTYILSPLVAAGAAWFGVICNNEVYIRRVDLATFAIADIPFPDAQATAPAGYGYLPP